MKKDLLKIIGFLLGVLGFVVFEQSGLDREQSIVTGVIMTMAFWWFTEAMEIYITSLVPIIVFPFTGVATMDEVAPLYMKQIIFLFIGGFLFAFALEKWQLHKRIAYRILIATGGSSSRVLLGFMLSSYVLSMWILNTATVTLLLPAVLAVTSQLGSHERSATPYLLGLAYASSIGGMATLIGTAPNFVFMEAFNSLEGVESSVTFANWITMAFPLSIVLFVAGYLLLRFMFKRDIHRSQVDLVYCRTSLASMGKPGYEERVLSGMFVVLVAAWFFMKEISLGSFTIPGWASYFNENAAYVKESTVVMFVVFLLFLIPSRKSEGYILSWEEVRKLPLGVLFLFGAGFTLGYTMTETGLTDILSGHLESVTDNDPMLVTVAACLLMTFITELASNTATIFLFLPVLFTMGPQMDCHPLQFYVPVTLSASCAFMLPVATPPNTIVFGSDQIRTLDMARTGLWLNLIAIGVLSLIGYWWIGMVV